MSLFRQHCVQTQYLHIYICNGSEKIKMTSQTMNNHYKTGLNKKILQIFIMHAGAHECMHM